jgi:glycerol uptake facilitator-like aquaporin
MKVRLPDLVRQFSAEVLGTFLLVLFGDGAIAQVVLGILSDPIYELYKLH